MCYAPFKKKERQSKNSSENENITKKNYIMKKNYSSVLLLVFTALLTGLFYSVNAQNATIDYRLYTTKTHPFMIPDLPNGSDYYLSIKTGHPVYISFSGTDKGSGVFYKLTSPGKIISGDTVLIDGGDVGNWLVNFNKLGVAQAISFHTNYQADLQDQTISSATYGNYPDFIWVAQGGSAKVSGSSNFGYGGSGYYKWKEITESAYTGGYTDSVRTFTKGSFIGRLNDGTGYWTNDTISILEKPTLNTTAKALNFPTTLTGITYKLLKVGSINGTDTTWTETANYVGDGNAKSFTLTDGKYKLTTTLGIHTAVYPYGYFVVGVTTALDKTKKENINYRLVDNKLQFDNEVNLKFYSLQGQLLQQEQGSSFKLCRQAGIFKATDKNGNVLTAKIILK
jgi:hypothetical protein